MKNKDLNKLYAAIVVALIVPITTDYYLAEMIAPHSDAMIKIASMMIMVIIMLIAMIKSCDEYRGIHRKAVTCAGAVGCVLAACSFI